MILPILLWATPLINKKVQIHPEPGYHLVWHDEFNGTGAPSKSKWGNEVGFIRNNELQYYANRRLKNEYQHNGHLTIEGIHENYKGGTYTSASLTTHHKFSFEYGRLEVRAKLPGGSGTWPAIWMMGEDIDQVGWPRCGELDVMEHVAFHPNTIFGTVHLPAVDGKGEASQGGKMMSSTCTNAYHVYRLDWSPHALKFYFDGKLYFTYPYQGPGKWVFDRPMYLILNLAIGGAWGGQKGVDASAYPQKFQIDYVRIWQKDRK